MESKTFFLTSMIVVALVAIITSLVSVSLLKEKLLLGPGQEGLLNVGGGFTNPTTNVIIVDTAVIQGISDIVAFSNMNRGQTASTSTTSPGPLPFVIRNIGNVNANVDVYSTGTQLFNSQYSTLKFWVEAGKPLTWPGMGYDQVSDCATTGPCFSAAACTSAAPCTLPYGTSDTSAVRAISNMDYHTGKNDAFLHMQIYIAPDEGAGTKQTTVRIVGLQM